MKKIIGIIIMLFLLQQFNYFVKFLPNKYTIIWLTFIGIAIIADGIYIYRQKRNEQDKP